MSSAQTETETETETETSQRWPRRRLPGKLMRLRLSTAGSVVIETALALMIFLMVVFGVFEFSIVLLSYCSATLACTQATRYGSLHSGSSLSPDTTADLKLMVTSKLYLGAAATPTVTVTYLTPSLLAGSNTVGNLVQIKATWNQTMALPFLAQNSFSVGTQDVRPITR